MGEEVKLVGRNTQGGCQISPETVRSLVVPSQMEATIYGESLQFLVSI